MFAPVKRSRWSAFVILATVVAIYQIAIVGSLAAMAGFFIPQQVHRAICLGAVLTAVFLGVWLGATGDDGAAPRRSLAARAVDVALWLSALAGLAYVVVYHEAVVEYSMMGFLDTQGMIVAGLICVPLVEAVRRLAGWTLAILVAAMVEPGAVALAAANR